MLRLKIEFEKLLKEGYDVELFEDNMYRWRLALEGPKQSPYVNGVFLLDIEFSQDFPIAEPVLKFLTKIYHPNVSNKGGVCTISWSPQQSIKSLLDTITNLLIEPNINDPLSPEIAKQYIDDIGKFKELAIEYTKKYAM